MGTRNTKAGSWIRYVCLILSVACIAVASLSNSSTAQALNQQEESKVLLETVTGTVTDAATGETLPGVNVVVKGTSIGIATDASGEYELSVESLQDTLVFSFIGYQRQEVPISGRTELNVSMQPEILAGEELVVTALGIEREEKALGYAIQEVGGNTLVEARENNIANAMSGKVAGLLVVRGSNGPASSSKIVLRGNNSLTGDNQPLIVVDGIPMDNFTGA